MQIALSSLKGRKVKIWCKKFCVEGVVSFAGNFLLKVGEKEIKIKDVLVVQCLEDSSSSS